jgi:alpha-tubulin suppressor-like RCC1 family protein
LVSLLGCAQGSESPVETSARDAVAGSATPIVFYQLSAGLFGTTCGVDTAQAVWCWGAAIGNRPVRQGGGVRIRQVSAGAHQVCAIGTDSLAYCFDLTAPIAASHEWVAVPGGHRFRQIDAGEFHACAVTTGNRAFCWGANFEGALGDGTTTARASPVPVKGGLQVRQIAAGFDFTCAVTTTSVAYCWGEDDHGQLGDDRVRLNHSSPRLVTGGHPFTKITAGANHACAVTEDEAAFCWGGTEGVGDGGSADRYVPSLVAGHHRFRRVDAGSSLTCGETPDSQTFCWGNNVAGGLGNGTTQAVNKPVLVVGGLRLAQVTTGGLYACGRTVAGAGYCWGYNSDGSLGDGSNVSRSTPTPVAPPQ